MRKSLAVLVATAALLLASVASVSAHMTGPCGTGQEESWSGRDYAAHHITEFADAGLLGQMHKPGSHMGFSACLGVHE